MISSENKLEKLTSDQLYSLAEFVVNENIRHHSGNIYPTNYKSEINSILEEEKTYFQNSNVYISRDLNKDIIASIRILYWNRKEELPIQKLFGINPLSATCSSNAQIWHIGRFAIKKGVRDVKLFKQLIICAIAPICQDKNSVAFAECDRRLLKVLIAFGIQAIPLDKGINYLSSETIPIRIEFKGLIKFYKKNKSMVSKDFCVLNKTDRQASKSVVSLSA